MKKTAPFDGERKPLQLLHQPKEGLDHTLPEAANRG